MSSESNPQFSPLIYLILSSDILAVFTVGFFFCILTPENTVLSAEKEDIFTPTLPHLFQFVSAKTS